MDITIKYKDGGTQVLRNLINIQYLDDETHYFRCNTDMAINFVTVVNEDGYFVRDYATQSFNAI